MRLVVDTNILFSYFWEKSFTRNLIQNSKYELFSPEFALSELKKYSKELLNKIRLDEREFKRRLAELKKIVKFIKKDEYSNLIGKAIKISPDEPDSHFLALCLKYNCPLWSRDLLLKEQNKVKVISTEDLIKLFL